MRPRALLLALLLCACRREPDFDERYRQANERISKAEAEIEAQVSGTATPAGEDPR